jgi:hypothetical protein
MNFLNRPKQVRAAGDVLNPYYAKSSNETLEEISCTSLILALRSDWWMKTFRLETDPNFVMTDVQVLHQHTESEFGLFPIRSHRTTRNPNSFRWFRATTRVVETIRFSLAHDKIKKSTMGPKF